MLSGRILDHRLSVPHDGRRVSMAWLRDGTPLQSAIAMSTSSVHTRVQLWYAPLGAVQTGMKDKTFKAALRDSTRRYKGLARLAKLTGRRLIAI